VRTIANMVFHPIKKLNHPRYRSPTEAGDFSGMRESQRH